MYCQKCGKEIDDNAVVCPNCGVPTENYQQPQQQPNIVINNANTNTNVNGLGVGISPKSRTVAALLCFFLGVLGIHRFYVGKTGTGVIWLFTAGLFGIGAIVDFIAILMGSFRDKYGLVIKNW
jgi:hypothetical protein